LTIRLNSQFEFFKACLTKNQFLKVSVKEDLFLFSRNKKLSPKFSIINKFNNRLINSNYFYV
jgi:hypothetical protein